MTIVGTVIHTDVAKEVLVGRGVDGEIEIHDESGRRAGFLCFRPDRHGIRLSVRLCTGLYPRSFDLVAQTREGDILLRLPTIKGVAVLRPYQWEQLPGNVSTWQIKEFGTHYQVSMPQ